MLKIFFVSLLFSFLCAVFGCNKNNRPMTHTATSVDYSITAIIRSKHVPPGCLHKKPPNLFRVVRRLETINTNCAAYSIYSQALLTPVRSFFIFFICETLHEKHAIWRAISWFSFHRRVLYGFPHPIMTIGHDMHIITDYFQFRKW